MSIKKLNLVGEVKGLVRDLVTLDKSTTQLEMENKKKKRRPFSKDSSPSCSSGTDSDQERAAMFSNLGGENSTTGGAGSSKRRSHRGVSSSAAAKSSVSGTSGNVEVRGSRFDTLEEEAPYDDDPYERRLKALQLAEQGHLQHSRDSDEYIQNLRQQLLIREDQLRNTERALLSKQKEIAQATVSLEEHRHNLVSTTEQLKHVTAQLEQAKQDKYELQHRVEELMAELSQMDSKVSTVSADLGRTNRKVAILQSQLQLEKSASESAQMEAERNQREIEALRTQVISLEGQLKEARLCSVSGTSAGSGCISSSRGDAELRDMVHRLQTQLRDTQESYKQLLKARRQEVAAGDQYITIPNDHFSGQQRDGGNTLTRASSTSTERARLGNPLSIHGLLRSIFNNPSNMIIITLIGLLTFLLYYFVYMNSGQPARIYKPCICPAVSATS